MSKFVVRLLLATTMLTFSLEVFNQLENLLFGKVISDLSLEGLN